MGDLNHLNICWTDNTAECKQSRRFLESTDDKFLTKVTEKMRRRVFFLDCIVTKNKGLVNLFTNTETILLST